GGSGNDVLKGTDNGAGEVDILTGGEGSDRFVLGEAGYAFYDDGNILSAGTLDYALITDFNAAEDSIQLVGLASDYVLGSTNSNTQLYLDSDGTGTISGSDELIAIVEGTSSLDLDTSFLYV
ncbi:MAG: hemolysin, partial [Leptolyngbya sp. SIO1D8]|nr:hemolysin [Leptolyngbya sp. SIO1D8]